MSGLGERHHAGQRARIRAAVGLSPEGREDARGRAGAGRRAGARPGLVACEREQQDVREGPPAASIARARADAATLAGAGRAHAATCGRLPDPLEAFAATATASGGLCGPFLARDPRAADGGAAWGDEARADGSFTVWTAGDNTTVPVP